MWYNEGTKLLCSRGAGNTRERELYLYERRAMNSLSPCPHYVYELVDPRYQSVFYVGITIDLLERFKQHMHCDGVNPQKDQRIQEILEAGHLPIMRTIEQVLTRDQAIQREQYWIADRLQLGALLVNISEIPGRIVRGPRVMRPIQRNASLNNALGRERKHADVIAMLTSVRDTGVWPDDVSLQMQRYYRREYSEFFRNDRRSKRLRLSHLAQLGGESHAAKV